MTTSQFHSNLPVMIQVVARMEQAETLVADGKKCLRYIEDTDDADLREALASALSTKLVNLWNNYRRIYEHLGEHVDDFLPQDDEGLIVLVSYETPWRPAVLNAESRAAVTELAEAVGLLLDIHEPDPDPVAVFERVRDVAHPAMVSGLQAVADRLADG